MRTIRTTVISILALGLLAGSAVGVAAQDEAGFPVDVVDGDGGFVGRNTQQVVNDGGGTAKPSDWTLIADGPTGFSGPGPSVSRVSERNQSPVSADRGACPVASSTRVRPRA